MTAIDRKLFEGIERLLRNTCVPGQPVQLMTTIDHLMQQMIGHKLFSILSIRPDTYIADRIYSSNPIKYPIGSHKDMTDSEWGRKVIDQKEVFLINQMDGIKRVFSDHEAIASLGCGSCVNFPVVYDGHCLGSVNILNCENWFNEGHITIGRILTPMIVPVFCTFK